MSKINPPMSVYKKIALSFVFFVLIIIGVIFYFTLHYAYIVVDPQEEPIETDFKFIIVEDESAVDFEQGIFQGKVVDEVITGERTFTTTGTKTLASDIVGQVTLYNELNSNQALVATTRLLTADNTLFRLKNAVNIPAQGSVTADVYPDDEAKAVVAPGTKFTIPGLSANLQEFVYAETEEGLKADGAKVKAIDQNDYDNAIKELSDQLSQQVLTDQDKNKVKILNKEVISSEFSNEIGDEADNFDLILEVRISGVIFNEKEIRDYAVSVLEGQVPGDKELVISSSDKLIYEIENFDQNNQVVQVKSNIKGLMIINEKSSILDRDKLIKLDFDEIKAYLENYDEVETVKIEFFPSWLQKVPFFEDHILIKIDK